MDRSPAKSAPHLRSQVPPSALPGIADATTHRDPNRWRRLQVIDSPLAADITVRVWGRVAPLLWQILAVALIAQMLEDGQSTPLTSADPLATELKAMIDQEWQAQTATP